MATKSPLFEDMLPRSFPKGKKQLVKVIIFVMEIAHCRKLFLFNQIEYSRCSEANTTWCFVDG